MREAADRCRARQRIRRLGRHLPVAALAVAFIALESSTVAHAASPVDHSERLEMVRSLGGRYPGYLAAQGDRYRDLGLFGGIAVQTEWQLASNRGVLELWNVVNESLTVLPFEYAKLFEAGGACSDDACRAWFEYFRIAAWQGPPSTVPHWLSSRWSRAQSRLWTAHEASVRAALERYAETLQDAFDASPSDEARFWRGWVRTVPLLKAGQAPTFDAEIVPISLRFFPDCGPLESGSLCAVALLTPTRRLFATTLIARGTPDGPLQLELGAEANSASVLGADAASAERAPPATFTPISAAPADEAGAACVPLEERTLDAQRRAALLSTHFFAYYDTDEGLPQSFRPIPLATAVDILLADDTAGSSDRRLRAAVALGGAGAGAGRAAAVERLVNRSIGPLAQIIDVAPPLDEETRRRREIDLYDRFRAGAPGLMGASCQRTRPTVAFDEPADGVLAATYTIDVQREAGEIARALDPRAWPQCGRFFASTCIVDRTAEGGFTVEPHPPSLGSSYTRLLYEHFVYESRCRWVGFRNVLSIASTSAALPDVRYDLEEALSTQLPGGIEVADGLEVDRGSLRILGATDLEAGEEKPRDGWQRIRVRKELRFGGNFSSWYFNLWRKPMLRLLVSELHDNACCSPAEPDPESCTLPP